MMAPSPGTSIDVFEQRRRRLKELNERTAGLEARLNRLSRNLNVDVDLIKDEKRKSMRPLSGRDWNWEKVMPAPTASPNRSPAMPTPPPLKPRDSAIDIRESLQQQKSFHSGHIKVIDVAVQRHADVENAHPIERSTVVPVESGKLEELTIANPLHVRVEPVASHTHYVSIVPFIYASLTVADAGTVNASLAQSLLMPISVEAILPTMTTAVSSITLDTDCCADTTQLAEPITSKPAFPIATASLNELIPQLGEPELTANTPVSTHFILPVISASLTTVAVDVEAKSPIEEPLEPIQIRHMFPIASYSAVEVRLGDESDTSMPLVHTYDCQFVLPIVSGTSATYLLDTEQRAESIPESSASECNITCDVNTLLQDVEESRCWNVDSAQEAMQSLRRSARMMKEDASTLQEFCGLVAYEWQLPVAEGHLVESSLDHNVAEQTRDLGAIALEEFGFPADLRRDDSAVDVCEVVYGNGDCSDTDAEKGIKYTNILPPQITHYPSPSTSSSSASEWDWEESSEYSTSSISSFSGPSETEDERISELSPYLLDIYNTYYRPKDVRTELRLFTPHLLDTIEEVDEGKQMVFARIVNWIGNVQGGDKLYEEAATVHGQVSVRNDGKDLCELLAEKVDSAVVLDEETAPKECSIVGPVEMDTIMNRMEDNSQESNAVQVQRDETTLANAVDLQLLLSLVEQLKQIAQPGTERSVKVTRASITQHVKATIFTICKVLLLAVVLLSLVKTLQLVNPGTYTLKVHSLDKPALASARPRSFASGWIFRSELKAVVDPGGSGSKVSRRFKDVEKAMAEVWHS